MKEKKDKPPKDDYREYVRRRLAQIAPVIDRVSTGEFDKKIDIPEGEEDEFTQLMVGLNLMIEDLRFMFAENRGKTEELKRRLTELSIFSEIGRALGSTLNLEELLEVIYRQTTRIMDTENFYIALYHEKTNTIEFPIFIDEGERIAIPPRKFSNALTEYIIKTREPLLIPEEVVSKTRNLGIEMVVKGAEPKCWLGVPMISRDRVVGVMSVQSTSRAHTYDEDHQRLLESVANAGAGAVANARAYQELERKVAELAAFNRVGRALGSTLDLSKQMDTIYQQITQVMPVDRFYVALYHPPEGDAVAELEFAYEVKDGTEQASHTRPFAGGLTEYLITNRKSVLIESGMDERIGELGTDEMDEVRDVKSWLGVPLVARGEVLGAMVVENSAREHAFDRDCADFLSSLASQVSGAIDNARAYRELENRLTELSVLNEISVAISSTLDIEELYEVVHSQIKRLMSAENFYIALYDPQTEEVSFPYAIERGERIITGEGEWATRHAGHGMTEYVIQTAKPQIVQGDSQAQLARKGVNHIGKASHSWIGAPMVARNQVIGVMAAQAFDPQVGYSYTHLRLLQLVANQAAPAVENARAYGVLERRVAERTAELQKSNDSLEDFVYTVSHDLKAPLRAILGFSQFLVEDYGSQLPQEGKMYVDRISQNSKRMENLIEDLLELSRAGRIKDPYQKTDVAELLKETIATLSPPENVTVKVGSPMPEIVCERVRIGQVFANLISNAVKYNDKEKPRIEVGAQDRGSEVEFSVADNGPGIPQRHHDKIFKIFQRLSAEGRGTGIGLALVKKIVEGHRGRIWVESEPGKGATFRFVLPKNPNQAEAG